MPTGDFAFEKDGLAKQGVKLYSGSNIVGSALFGGPLAAGYLLSRNFKNLGNGDAARTSLLIAIGVIVLLAGIQSMIPAQMDKIPLFLFPIAFVAIANYLVDRFQTQQIKQHIENGGKTASWLNALGISIVSLLLTFVIFIVAISYFGGGR